MLQKPRIHTLFSSHLSLRSESSKNTIVHSLAALLVQSVAGDESARVCFSLMHPIKNCDRDKNRARQNEKQQGSDVTYRLESA